MIELIDDIEKKNKLIAKEIFEELGFEIHKDELYRAPQRPIEHTEINYRKTDQLDNKWDITTNQVYQGNRKRTFIELFGTIEGRTNFRKVSIRSRESSFFSFLFRRKNEHLFKTKGLDKREVENLIFEFAPLADDYFSIEVNENKMQIHYILESLDFENLRLFIKLAEISINSKELKFTESH